VHPDGEQGPDDELPDRIARFVGGPGDGIIYGPDGRPWTPGDPIPARASEPTSDE